VSLHLIEIATLPRLFTLAAPQFPFQIDDGLIFARPQYPQLTSAGSCGLIRVGNDARSILRPIGVMPEGVARADFTIDRVPGVPSFVGAVSRARSVAAACVSWIELAHWLPSPLTAHLPACGTTC
jgi:hypothetical protein